MAATRGGDARRPFGRRRRSEELFVRGWSQLLGSGRGYDGTHRSEDVAWSERAKNDLLVSGVDELACRYLPKTVGGCSA